MKIHFDTAYGSQNVDNTATAYGQPAASAKDAKGSYQTDISGTVMDNNAYAGHGRTAEDVMAEAGQQDVALQRNYMAVMSNSMSEEDFAKLQEEGFHPGAEDIERIVTILDKIKAQLLKAGENISGYTDTLDQETLEQITGSKSYANTIKNTFARYDVPLTPENVAKAVQTTEEALELGELSEDAVKYMVQNKMEPTVQNLYLAQHGTNGQAKPSSGYYSMETGGYYAKKADSIHWDQLMPAMEQVVKEASALADEAPTLEEAKWLVEHDIELNVENLNKLHRINGMTTALNPQTVIETAAIAITDGIRPDKMPLDQTQTAGERAVLLEEEIHAIPQEAVDAAVEETQSGVVNLRTLRNVWQQMQQGEYTNTSSKNLAARRMLEEVRLHMTTEANLRLIKSNYAIETAPLEELVEALKQAQQEIDGKMFGQTEDGTASERAQLYRETLYQSNWLHTAPAAVIGRIATDYQETTLTELTKEAASLQKSYEKAGQSYELLMTAPRRDLGDSIKNAFRNVDAILEDMELENSALNQRAVRILGYNSMEITPEAIAQVKAADVSVQSVIEKMTPSAVLGMIREGKNPLSMSLGELDSYLSGQENPEQEMERYSKYLYKLEQHKEITEEEKESYIGIYRMLRQLEKNDGAAVGSLIDQGLELSFSNLLGAVRTAKKGGMDITIDDSVGSVSKKETGTQDITSQIQTAFVKELHTIREQLSPDMLKNGIYSEEMSLEALYEAVQEENTSKERQAQEADYRREELTYYRKAATVSEAAVEELLNYGQPVSTDYAMAAQSLLYNRGSLWKRALERQDETQLAQKLKQLQESFQSEPEAKETYQNYVEEVQEALSEEQAEDTRFVDVREKLLLHKQLSLCKNLAQEENYEIPVMIQGRLTSINLRILHTPERQSKTAVTMETEEYGKIAGELAVKGKKVTGYLTCEGEEGKTYLETLRDKMEAGLREQGYEVNGLQTILTKELDLPAFSQKVTQDRESEKEVVAEEKESANALYRIAKLFLNTVA